MADLSITAANVKSSAGSIVDRGVAGATVTAGQQVYKDPATGKYLLADNNSATVRARTPDGTALHGASLDQPLAVHREGDITIGATLVAGTDYWLGDVPGAICPRADIATGESPCLLGVAKSTSVLAYKIAPSGVTL